ncbi:MAG: hypothetical protein AB8G86_00545 [Saprospiraceae bacterium]
MTTIYSVYDQIAGLLAQLEPEKILAIQASIEMQTRFNILVEKSKQAQISVKEKDELNHFIVLERLFRLSKIKAHIAQKTKK